MTSSDTLERMPAPARWATKRTPSRPTIGPRIAEVMRNLSGNDLMPWQTQVADVIGEYEGDVTTGDGFRLFYGEWGIVVPRQSGKTTLEFGVITDRGVNNWFRPTISSLSMQTKKDALIKIKDEFLDILKASPYADLDYNQNGDPVPQGFHWRGTNGMEQLKWRNGSQFEPMAPTKDAGHSRSRDFHAADEVWFLRNFEVEQGVRPAMITKSATAQYGWSSTVGDHTSIYLTEKMELGRRAVEQGVNEGFAYFEWSADPDDDPDDPETWWRCMPALGITQSVEGVRALQLGMPPDEFARAFLNIPKARKIPTAIDPDVWRKAKRAGKVTGRKCWALSTGPDQSSASLAVAGFRADGNVQLLTMDHGPGVGWVVGKLQAAGVTDVWLDRMLDGSLVHDLTKAGLTVHEFGTADVINGAARLMLALREGTAFHAGQAVLDDAAGNAGSRKVRSGDGMLFKRIGGVDISPLNAVSIAHWALLTAPEPKKRILRF